METYPRKMTKEPRITTSSLRTKSSLEIAAAEVAAVKVTIPVFETREFPGRASMRADALAAGAGWEDWKRALECCNDEVSLIKVSR